MEVYREVKKTNTKITEHEIHHSLTNIVPIWNELYPTEKQRVLELLIEKVVMHTEFIDIRIQSFGIENLVKELEQAA